MCGRFTLTSVDEQIADLFDVLEVPARETKFNIAPTQSVLVLTNRERQRELSLMRWGLIPSWSKTGDTTLTFNARSETVREKPSFIEPFERRRCLIPADGFYEWRGKQPFRFVKDDRSIFAFAGLWDRWIDERGNGVESATILTTVPNQTVSKFHDRMAVIISPKDYKKWLDPSADLDETFALLQPCDDAFLVPYAVDPRVGTASFEDPAAIKKSEVQGELF